MPTSQPPPTRPKQPTRRDLYDQLKKNPVAFRQAADLEQNRGMGIPSRFWNSLAKENKEAPDAITVMAALHAKPSNWQWTAEDLEKFTGLSRRAVNRGVGLLKQLGWIAHANVSIEGETLGVFIMTFDKQIEEEDRQGRFSLFSRNGQWTLRTPRKKQIAVEKPKWAKQQGNEDSPCERRVRGHNVPSKESSSQTLLRRAEEDRSLPAAPHESEASDNTQSPEVIKTDQIESDDFSYRPPRQRSKEQITPCSRSEEEIAADREIVQELERLGRKRTESDAFDDHLDYEEFVNESVLPRLIPPTATAKSRKKTWNINWVQENMWGLLFMQLSKPGESWNNNQARRLIRRIEEGYISPRQMRIVLYSFDWKRHKKTLEGWTLRGKRARKDGSFDFVDEWKKKFDSSFHNFQQGKRLWIAYERNQLYPDEEQMEACCEPAVDRILYEREKQISNGFEGIDEISFHSNSLRSEEVLGVLLAHRNLPLPDKAKRRIAEEKEGLIRWLATDRTGVMLWKEQGHSFNVALGDDFSDRVVSTHRQFVKRLRRRLKNYDLLDEVVVELL